MRNHLSGGLLGETTKVKTTAWTQNPEGYTCGSYTYDYL